MANYSLVINSRFRPFGYQELLAPVLMATQAQQQIEDVYGDLNTKASVWDTLTEGSPKARSMYQGYMKALKEERDLLAKQGLTPSSRQKMHDLRGRYTQDITPIEQAYARRKEQADEQRKAMLSNPTLLLDRNAASTNLDAYIDNPNLGYSTYSGALLTNQVSQQAAHLSKVLSNYGKGKPLDAYTNTFLKQHGFTPSQVYNAINNPRDPNSSPILNAIVESVMGSSGITENWADNAYNRGYDFARQGLWSAVGQSDISTFENKGAVLAAQDASRRAAANQGANALASIIKDRLKMYDPNPTSYYSRDEITAENNKLATELKKWKDKKYFNSEGKLTNAGWEALTTAKRIEGRPSLRKGPGGDYYEVPNVKEYGDMSFLKWAQEHGVTNKSDRRSINILNKYYKDTSDAIRNGTLATGVANFQVYRQTLDEDSGGKLVSKILNSQAKGGVHEAGNLKDGTISQGNKLSIDEFKEAVGYDNSSGKAHNVLYSINSPYTGKEGQQLIETKDGRRFIIEDPVSVFGITNYADLSAANTKMRNANSIFERATNADRANTFMAAPLTTVKGTDIKPNDGTYRVTDPYIETLLQQLGAYQ